MCFKIEVTLLKDLRAVVYQCDDHDNEHNGHNEMNPIFRKKIIPNSCPAQIYLEILSKSAPDK